MMGCALSNVCDRANYAAREAQYLNIARQYTSKELQAVGEMLGIITMALDEEPEQDFLGSLFMRLELGNNWKGQFFTPIHICRLMSNLCGSMSEQVKKQGFIEINDPTCGAGATLIAAVEQAKKENIDFQSHILFVGQDIDFIASMMCYIQISILGCAGYVIHADTLMDPATVPLNDQGNIWYTPLYFSDTWEWRRICRKMDDFCALPLRQEAIAEGQTKVEEPQQLTFF